jgi:hypothetical protein
MATNNEDFVNSVKGFMTSDAFYSTLILAVIADNLVELNKNLEKINKSIKHEENYK